MHLRAASSTLEPCRLCRRQRGMLQVTPWPAGGSRTAQAQRAGMICSAGPFEKLTQLFSRPQAATRLKRQRAELLDSLSEPSPDSSRVDELIEEMISTSQPFQENLLGGGPWQVIYTSGPLLWQRITGGKRSTKASQEFVPEGRQVINRGSLLGSLAEVTAQGTYQLADQEDPTVLPARIEASVAGGRLSAFGLNIPLPIKGSGLVDLLYLDQDIRIFRSPDQGAIAVQQRSAAA